MENTDKLSDFMDLFSVDNSTKRAIPLITFGLSCGFPSPSLDHIDKKIDLNEVLIPHPNSTYFGRAKGKSMINAGIEDGDLLVIDRGLEPVNGKIILCFINGEFSVKQLSITPEGVELISFNPNYPPIKIKNFDEFQVWGVVTHIIKSV